MNIWMLPKVVPYRPPFLVRLKRISRTPLGAGKKSPFARGCRSEPLHQKKTVCVSHHHFFSVKVVLFKTPQKKDMNLANPVK